MKIDEPDEDGFVVVRKGKKLSETRSNLPYL